MLWLVCRGYRIHARRARTPVGEIDLIARRRGVIVFVEVKRRATQDAAAEALSPGQRGRILRAAEWWLAKRPQFAEDTVRFDAILIGRTGLRHLRGAFDASSGR